MGFQRLRTALLFLTVLLLIPLHSTASWFSSFSSSPQTNLPLPTPDDAMRADFSLQGYDNPKGAQLVADAREKQFRTCWGEALEIMFASCADILGDEEKHMRMAWMLSECYVADSGRPGLPACGERQKMRGCRKKLKDFEESVYLMFFTETNQICHQLQADMFKQQTEWLINGLKDASHMAEEKLIGLETKTEELFQSSMSVLGSLASVDRQTQELVERSGDVDARIRDVLRHSQDIQERTKGIVASQLELQEGQTLMRGTIEDGVELLRRWYLDMVDEMEALRKEALAIEQEIGQVGSTMTDKMSMLQSTADGIGEAAVASLDKQRELLSGQTRAIEGLDLLTKSQSQALEESRQNLQRLAEFSQNQQEKLLRSQEEIQQAHDRLIHNSQSILAAQREFESKQENIFAALDNLFSLHNAILLESRFLKSVFFYCSMTFLAYLLTSAKQTFSVRARLYLGLCMTFLVEHMIARFFVDDFQQPQTGIKSKAFIARSTFVLAASLQIIYSIFTYRDYEVLNHQMLQELKAKIDEMEKNTAKGGLFALSMDTEPDLYDWIDEDFPEDVSSYDDPDYHVSEEVVAENSVMCTVQRSYGLRPRKGRR